jgi:hypothetical protein
MSDTSDRWVWYERPGFVIAALVVFWPVGLWLMWDQKKFSQETRVGVSIAAVMATALIVAGIVVPPSVGVRPTPGSTANGGSPFAGASQVTSATSPSTSATGSATATPSVGSSGTPAGGKAPAKSPGSSPSAGSVSPPKSTPAVPGAPETPDPSGPERFTMTGTARSQTSGTMYVAFSLKAAAVADAVKYEWWIYSPSGTNSYQGQTVTGGYYGLTPTGVLLVVRDGAGSVKSYTAEIVDSGGNLSATGR